MKNTWLDSIRTKLAQRKFEAKDSDWDAMERLLDTHLPANANHATKSAFFHRSPALHWLIVGAIAFGHAASNPSGFILHEDQLLQRPEEIKTMKQVSAAPADIEDAHLESTHSLTNGLAPADPASISFEKAGDRSDDSPPETSFVAEARTPSGSEPESVQKAAMSSRDPDRTMQADIEVSYAVDIDHLELSRLKMPKYTELSLPSRFVLANANKKDAWLRGPDLAVFSTFSSTMGTGQGLGLLWLNKRHYLGIGVDYIKDDLIYRNAHWSEEMEIDWRSQNIVQSSWGISKIDSSWIIAGINQGHWQVDTFYAETFDTVVVMVPDTQQLLRLHTLEKMRSTRSYSIPIRFGWRSSHGRWDHLMGVSMSIGFIEKTSFDLGTSVAVIDRDLRYAAGIELGTQYFLRPGWALGLSWTPMFRSTGDARTTDRFYWDRLDFRLIYSL